MLLETPPRPPEGEGDFSWGGGRKKIPLLFRGRERGGVVLI
jgi:hypothetical protein